MADLAEPTHCGWGHPWLVVLSFIRKQSRAWTYKAGKSLCCVLILQRGKETTCFWRSLADFPVGLRHCTFAQGLRAQVSKLQMCSWSGSSVLAHHVDAQSHCTQPFFLFCMGGTSPVIQHGNNKYYLNSLRLSPECSNQQDLLLENWIQDKVPENMNTNKILFLRILIFK